MANTTEDKLRAALGSKEGIRRAIESKGVECGADVPLSAYPSRINQIQHLRGLRIRGVVIPLVLGKVVCGDNAGGLKMKGTLVDTSISGILTRKED